MVASVSATAAIVDETSCNGVVDNSPSPVSVSVSANVVSVASRVPAPANADGTNADPKIPASKLAVATAVANFFLMNYCESQSRNRCVFETDSDLLCI
jgi:hypothetical protein